MKNTIQGRKVRKSRRKGFRFRKEFLLTIALILISFVGFTLFSLVATALGQSEGEELYKESMQKIDEVDINDIKEDGLNDDNLSVLNGDICVFREKIQKYKEPLERELIKRNIEPKYSIILLGILSVESDRNPSSLKDPFQTSKYLSSNIRTPNQSIDAAVDLFEKLYNKALDYNLDILAVIQSYNFGPKYLDYIHSFDLGYSISTAREYSGLVSIKQTIVEDSPLSGYYDNMWNYENNNSNYVPLVLEQLGYSDLEIEKMCK